ncbi:protein S100-A12-like [Suncus etruscus]|uniref:protein S100-A12-like n=1 Tax=Suncus etruscus TaxID=109475 RepID=UPI00210FFD20|nr:protein S100-A12-like [Suncus etruscus]
MTKLEDYLEGIVNIFHQNSVKVGHADTLSKGELSQLITQEMPNILKQFQDRNPIDKIFQELDIDRDAIVNLDEFIKLVSKVLVTAHNNKHRPY